jgi:hypothetical protein
MAHVRCIAVQARPTEFLDVTSVTLDEFPRLVPPVAAALHAQMASWYLDGKPRTARRFTVDKNCPLPPGRAKPPSRLSRQHLAMPSLTRPLHGCGRCRSRPNASQWRWKHGLRKVSCRGCHPRRGILVL